MAIPVLSRVGVEMIVVACPDVERAKEIGELIEGRKVYVVKVQDGTELRHKIHSWQPEVVIIDVTLGGNGFEALQELPAILDTRSEPAVIVLIPKESATARNAAAEMGAFEVFNLGRPSWKKDLPRAVLEAQAARLAGALERPKKPEPGVLH